MYLPFNVFITAFKAVLQLRSFILCYENPQERERERERERDTEKEPCFKLIL